MFLLSRLKRLWQLSGTTEPLIRKDALFIHGKDKVEVVPVEIHEDGEVVDTRQPKGQATIIEMDTGMDLFPNEEEDATEEHQP
jgi:hypothetical protein